MPTTPPKKVQFSEKGTECNKGFEDEGRGFHIKDKKKIIFFDDIEIKVIANDLTKILTQISILPQVSTKNDFDEQLSNYILGVIDALDDLQNNNDQISQEIIKIQIDLPKIEGDLSEDLKKIYDVLIEISSFLKKIQFCINTEGLDSNQPVISDAISLDKNTEHTRFNEDRKYTFTRYNNSNRETLESFINLYFKNKYFSKLEYAEKFTQETLKAYNACKPFLEKYSHYEIPQELIDRKKSKTLLSRLKTKSLEYDIRIKNNPQDETAKKKLTATKEMIAYVNNIKQAVGNDGRITVEGLEKIKKPEHWKSPEAKNGELGELRERIKSFRDGLHHKEIQEAIAAVKIAKENLKNWQKVKGTDNTERELKLIKAQLNELIAGYKQTIDLHPERDQYKFKFFWEKKIDYTAKTKLKTASALLEKVEKRLGSEKTEITLDEKDPTTSDGRLGKIYDKLAKYRGRQKTLITATR